MIESKGAQPIQQAEVLPDVPKKGDPVKPNAATKNIKLFLSHEESAQLAANSAKVTVIKQERKLLELRKLLIDSQDNTLKRDRIILNNDMKNIDMTDQRFKDDNEAFLNLITKKYKRLEDGKWGYNPQNGEIIIKD